MLLMVDHLMMGVADFEATAARWHSEYGLSTAEGIHFDDAPSFVNKVIPLGETWIELVGIAHTDEAAADPLAQGFSAMVRGGDRLLGWALAPPDLKLVADRIKLPISEQHATHKETGERFTWRQLGFAETRMDFYLPFFIGWDHDIHRDMRSATSEVGNATARQDGIKLQLVGDPKKLEEWLGDLSAPLEVCCGDPMITARIVTDRGDLFVQ